MARLFRKSGQTQSRQGAKGRIEELDDLLKLNRGGFSMRATDTGATPSYILPFQRTLQGQITDSPLDRGIQNATTPDFKMNFPEYVSEAFPEWNPPQMGRSPEFDFNQPRDRVDVSDDLGSVSGFFNYINRIVQDSAGASPYGRGIMSMADGGTLYEDGIIRYQDGTERQFSGDQKAFAYRSNADGSIGYSDGSKRVKSPEPIASMQDPETGREMIRYSDGSVRWGRYLTKDGQMSKGGLEGLVGLFGIQNPFVTQAYGATNDGNLGYFTHGGTDIRTRDLQNRTLSLPFDVEIVEVRRDDGTRFGDRSGHGGYGNSVLVRLPNGSLVRLSHLDQMGNFQAGQVLRAGELIGTPGSTGNSTAEHLDVEYFDERGERVDPEQFKGVVKPELLFPNQPMPGSVVGQPNQSQAPQAQSQAPRIPTPATDLVEKVAQVPKQAAQSLGRTIDENKPLNQATQGLGLGVSELLEGDRAKAGQEIAQTGQRLGIPELRISEVASGQMGPGQAFSGSIEQYAPKTRFDLGLSELLRGDTQGAKSVFSDTLSRVGQRVAQLPTQIKEAIVKPVYADDERANEVLPAGEGLKNITNQKPLQSRPQTREEREIGDVSGQSSEVPQMSMQGSPFSPVVGTAQSMASRETGDNRDPFFKSGLVNQFTNFLKEGAEKGKALTMDIFKPDLYKSPEMTSKAFAGTHLADPAGQKASQVFQEGYRQTYADPKYSQESVNKILSGVPSSLNYTPNLSAPDYSGEYFKNQYLQRYGGAEYDQGDVQRILSSIPNSLNYTPNLPEPKKAYVPPPAQSQPRPIPSLQDYFNQGKTVAQWFAETGQQGKLDELGRAGYDPRSNTNPFNDNKYSQILADVNSSGFTPAQTSSSPSYNFAGQPVSMTPQYAVDTAIKAAGTGQTMITRAGNPLPNYTPANANMTDASTGLPVVGSARTISKPPEVKPQESLFSKIKRKLFG